MSRNLARTDCKNCPGNHDDIILDESPRPITVEDCGAHYFPSYTGLIVAKAHCRMCHALYLAWVDWPGKGYHWELNNRINQRFTDLSYQHSFNDEPSPEDTPLFVVERIIRHVRRPAIVRESDYRHYNLKETDKSEFAKSTKASCERWLARLESALRKKLTIEDEGGK
jgi:hypothetical protein